MIRREARDALWRGREVIGSGLTSAVGLWLCLLGGFLILPGAVLMGVGLWLAILGWRRLRFRRSVDVPGVVEVDERQVGYLGPTFGGFVSLNELVEIRLISVQGHRLWRLKQSDGQALLIPTSATGSERLFDAFAALPGLETHLLLAALDSGAENAVVWRTDNVRPMLR